MIMMMKTTTTITKHKTKKKFIVLITLGIGVLVRLFHSWGSFLIIFDDDFEKDTNNKKKVRGRVVSSTTTTTTTTKPKDFKENDNKDNNDDDDVYLVQQQSSMNGIIKNINWNISAPCGAHKCFFRSWGEEEDTTSNKSNNKSSNDIGYLIQQKEVLYNRSEDLFAQYKANNYLSLKYNQSNFLLGEPIQYNNITQEFVTNLSRLAITRRREPRYISTKPIIIQKVQIAPPSSILIGCHYGRQKDITDKFGPFLDKVVINNNNNNDNNNKDNITKSFKLQLQKELSKTIHVMEKELWYAKDWQGIISSYNGRLYDMDVAPMMSSSYDDNDNDDNDNNNNIIIDDVGFTNLDWIDCCCEMYTTLIQQIDEYYYYTAGGKNATATTTQQQQQQHPNSICSTSIHSFSWDDLNITTTTTALDDIFIYNSSNASSSSSSTTTLASIRNPNIGYTIVPVPTAKAYSVHENATTTVASIASDSILHTNWERAKLFTNQYKIRHTILGRPNLIPVAPNSFLRHHQNDDDDDEKQRMVLIQKVRQRPKNSSSTPTVLFSCDTSILKLKNGYEKSIKFMDKENYVDHYHMMINFVNAIQDRKQFSNRLKKVVNRISTMLLEVQQQQEQQQRRNESTTNTLIFSNLNGYIDTAGDIYLLDLYRMFNDTTTIISTTNASAEIIDIDEDVSHLLANECINMLQSVREGFFYLSRKMVPRDHYY